MTTAAFTVRTPADLIALAPHLLGFRPRESVVLMSFGDPDGTFHARVDLPPDPEGRREVTGMLLDAVARNDADTTAVLVFSTDVEASRAQAESLVEGLLRAGVGVLDVLRVEDDRFFRPLEGDEVGTAYDVSAHPFTARRVYEGHVVHPSREALADTLVGTDEDDRAAVAAAAAAHDTEIVDVSPAGLSRLGRGEGLWIQGRVRRHLRGPRLLSADEAGRMLTALRSTQLRDVAWAEMNRKNAARHVVFWTDLVRRAPDHLLPPAAALLACAAWLAGDGALAWCALDRCLELDPDYSMAHLVADALSNAVSPAVWRQIPQSQLPVLGVAS